jgi:hypothetical protein
MSMHPAVLKEMELIGWVKLSGTDYEPTERGKNLAQQLIDTGEYNNRMIAQAIDPTITPLSEEEKHEMLYQEMTRKAHERLLEDLSRAKDEATHLTLFFDAPMRKH